MIRDTESGRFQTIAGPWKCVKCALELETTPHQCPACLKIRNKEYKDKHRGPLNEAKRQRRLASGKFCQWPSRCKDCGIDLIPREVVCSSCSDKRRIDRNSVSREKHTPQTEAQKKRQKNTMRRWRTANIERLKAYAKKRQQHRTPEQRAMAVERMKRWYQENKERYNSTQNARRYRSQAAVGRYSDADVIAIWDRQKHQCAVPDCTKKIAASGPNRYHVDHIKALVNGGANTPDNLQILCRSHNCSKSDADEFEWAQRHGLLFVK